MFYSRNTNYLEKLEPGLPLTNGPAFDAGFAGIKPFPEILISSSNRHLFSKINTGNYSANGAAVTGRTGTDGAKSTELTPSSSTRNSNTSGGNSIRTARSKVSSEDNSRAKLSLSALEEKYFTGGKSDVVVPTLPELSQNSRTDLSPEESQRRLKTIVSAALKVLNKDQVAIVVMVPHTIHWVSTQQQQQLGTTADDVNDITTALEPKLGGPNSELVAEHIVRASTRAQLGIQNRNSIELRASERAYNADVDCYFDDPDLHAIVVLLTPMNDTLRTGYEEAQLSSMRYHIGFMNGPSQQRSKMQNETHQVRHSSEQPSSLQRPDINSSRQHSHPPHGTSQYPGSQDSQHRGQSPQSNGVANHLNHQHDHSHRNEYDMLMHAYAGSGQDIGNLQNHLIHDFIPSMTYREVEYFYSLLPGTASGLYSHHELEVSRSSTIQEQEQQAEDPDRVDPHMSMRMIQDRSLMPVVPREPRKFAEVQQEMMEARSSAHTQVQSSGSLKKADTKCLECGIDSSPEWRKGPLGPKTLCNRCGLRYAKKLRSQK